MSMSVSNAALWTAVWMLVKSSVFLAVVALGLVVTRRRTSAAARHLAWTFAVVGLLLLPLLSALFPTRIIAVRLATTPDAPLVTAHARDQFDQASGSSDPAAAAVSIPVLAATAPADRQIPWATALLSLYVAGVFLLLARVIAQRLTIERLARQAAKVDDPHWRRLLAECARTLAVECPLHLLRSRDRTMPMVFGTRSPVILLPAIADTWSDDRRRAVLLHELAHVDRRDCLAQMLAAVACAVYWIHPGVWWVARRLRVERELACDDRVLTAGTHARDYAGHLLEIAHTLGGGRAPALVVSMARPRQLEGRMLAVMDGTRNRAVPGFRSRLAGVAITAALILPLASAGAAVVDDGIDEAPAVPARSGSAELASETNIDPRPITALGFMSEPAQQFVRSAATAIAQAGLRGTWEIRPSAATGTVYIRLTEGDSSSGSTIALGQLEGLTPAQLSGAGGLVRFSIRRDAGTLTFEGTARDGVGAGTYTFTPNPTFAADLEKRGVGRPTAAEQYALARGDIGFAFLDELTAQGYARPALSQLVRAGQHGAHLTYLREMGGAGYHLGSLDTLIELRDHGVTPEFVRQLAAQGFKGLSADELRRTRDHGVSADFVREFRELGYSSATLDQLVTVRDHGVSAEFVRDLAALGHRNLPLEDVVRLRDHGISASYARELRELGLSLTLEQLVTSRDHGLSADFVRELVALGYRNLPLEPLIRLRDHGVTAAYVRELKELGYDRLNVDEVVSLRDHGVTPDQIRRANTRAGTHLPLDMIKSLASNGGLR